MQKGWQVRPSTFFGLALLIEILAIPLPAGEDIWPFIAIGLFIVLKRSDHIKKAKWGDVWLVLLYMLIGLIGMIYLQVITLAEVSWPKILLIGIAADVAASMLSGIPVLGDVLSGIVNAIIAIVVIGGLPGTVLAFTMFFISAIPGPSLGMNTIVLVIAKVISEWIS
jgi:hypothetical protein